MQELTQKKAAKLNALFEPKGYGFLHQNDNGTLRSFFFHLTYVVSGIPEIGCEVLFTPSSNSKGPIAIDVEVLPKGVKASDVLAERTRRAALAITSSEVSQ
jgi:cold shock CspA family protein